MRNFPRVTALLFTLLCTCAASPFALSAQEDYAVSVARFTDDHNAVVSVQHWAKVEHAAVTLRINEHNELVAEVDNEQQLRLVLQRAEPSDMDEMFPRRIDSAIIVITNTSAIIIDPVEKVHFALSLDAEPKLPGISGEPTLVFTGFGLGRHWSGM